jgi:hypothetical protein
MQDFDGTQPNLALGQFAYATPSGPINCQAFPRYVFHASEKPRIVSSQGEKDALGEDWQDTYIKQDYPKIKFGPEGEVTAVENPEDEGKLEGSWSDTPPEKPPKQKRPDQRTLQELGEAIRDSRRLSLDYGQLNQDLDLKADNVATREISPQELPHPVVHPVETTEQRKQREAEQDAARKRKEAEDRKEEKKRP